MKIEIGRPLKKQKYKNVYKIIIDFMYGDGDGSGTEEVIIEKNSIYLERFIAFLEKCIDFDADQESFLDLEDAWLFLEDGLEYTEEEDEVRLTQMEKEIEESVYFSWHSDVAREGYRASLQDYTITFFDENGIEYKVIIK